MAPDPNLVRYRVEVREAEASLRRLDELEVAWRDYIDAVRKIVSPADGLRALPDEAMLPVRIQAAELERLKIVSLLPTALPSYSNRALADLTAHNLRTDFSAFLETVRRNSRTLDGEVVSGEIGLNLFEGKVGECTALFEARRRELQAGRQRLVAHVEETELAVNEERKHELEKIIAAQPNVWRQLAATRLGRLLLWLLRSTWGRVVSAAAGALVAIYIIPPVRRAVAALLDRILGASP